MVGLGELRRREARAAHPLEDVDGLRLAAHRVERDRVFPGEPVADLLALEFVGVLLVGRELVLGDAAHPQPHLLRGEEEAGALQVGRRRPGRLVEVGLRRARAPLTGRRACPGGKSATRARPGSGRRPAPLRAPPSLGRYVPDGRPQALPSGASPSRASPGRRRAHGPHRRRRRHRGAPTPGGGSGGPCRLPAPRAASGRASPRSTGSPAPGRAGGRGQKRGTPPREAAAGGGASGTGRLRGSKAAADPHTASCRARAVLNRMKGAAILGAAPRTINPGLGAPVFV